MYEPEKLSAGGMAILTRRYGASSSVERPRGGTGCEVGLTAGARDAGGVKGVGAEGCYAAYMAFLGAAAAQRAVTVMRTVALSVRPPASLTV
ncbi:hypothetical protein GCM10023205_29340 [Yinghuangia aomiensis]|uniref:Uncharacterized protein n=1 Tax=Yinghuangia aomiensis TaxID=676205 RepID=A0ABP9H829_9ACTN